SFMSSSTLLLSAYIPRPPISTFFPYTTLFRSTVGVAAVGKQPVHQLGCGRLVGRGHRRQRGGIGTRQQYGRHGQREGQQESGNSVVHQNTRGDRTMGRLRGSRTRRQCRKFRHLSP